MQLLLGSPQLLQKLFHLCVQSWAARRWQGGVSCHTVCYLRSLSSMPLDTWETFHRWIHTQTHTEGGCRGVSEVREKKGKTGERILLLVYKPTNNFSPSLSLFLCFSNQQRVGLRVSWLWLAISAWLPTDWNTIKVKSQREKEKQPAGTVMGVHARWHRCTNSMCTVATFLLLCRCVYVHSQHH